MPRSIWDLYTYDYWYKFWVRVHVRAHHMDVQRMYERMRKEERDEMMKVNEIHKMYPQFGNAKNEDDLIEEAMKAEVKFGQKVKVVMNPEYYKKYFKDIEPSEEVLKKIKKAKGRYYAGVAGYNIETSTLVDTYIFEFQIFTKE